jgi:hypothetical protein
MVGRFEEDKHPRGGKGSQQGGRFVSKGGGGSSVAKPTKRAAKANPTSDAVRQYIDPNSDSHAVKLNQVIRQKGVLTSEQKGVVLAIDKAIDEGNTTIVKADFMEVYLSKEDKAWLTTAGKG